MSDKATTPRKLLWSRWSYLNLSDAQIDRYIRHSHIRYPTLDPSLRCAKLAFERIAPPIRLAARINDSTVTPDTIYSSIRRMLCGDEDPRPRGGLCQFFRMLGAKGLFAGYLIHSTTVLEQLKPRQELSVPQHNFNKNSLLSVLPSTESAYELPRSRAQHGLVVL